MVAGPARPQVHIHLDHGRSPERWRQRYIRGEVWETSPYGYEYAQSFYDTSFSHDHTESSLTRFLRRGAYWALGFDLVHALRNARALAQADVVWTHTEHEHLAVVAALRLTRARRRPRIVAQSVWLWDHWDAQPAWRRRLVRSLLGDVAVHTTFSPLGTDRAREVLGPRARVHTVPYGTHAVAGLGDRVPRQDGTVRVVAPGNDRDRDWAVLLEAARRDPSLEVRVLTKRRLPAIAYQLPNVSVQRATRTSQLLEHYTWADVVAVPLQPNLHVSGSTVSIEGLNLGLPVVVTREGGLDSYFDDEDVHFTRPGDPASWVQALHEAAERDARDPGLRARRQQVPVERGLTARDYIHRHVLLTELALGRPVDEGRISALVPVAEPVLVPRTVPDFDPHEAMAEGAPLATGLPGDDGDDVLRGRARA